MSHTKFSTMVLGHTAVYSVIGGGENDNKMYLPMVTGTFNAQLLIGIF